MPVTLIPFSISLLCSLPLPFRLTLEKKTKDRRAALIHHPDKKKKTQLETVLVEDDSIFKKISKAYEILGDPIKRKQYDSQDSKFDDTIPGPEEGKGDDFFSVFVPVFARYSRWSDKNNCPQLGDKETPIEQVFKFYRFWASFRSWRDYSYLDEYNPEEAESRDERRWMNRQNSKVREKMKREEFKRIITLVGKSYKTIPPKPSHLSFFHHFRPLFWNPIWSDLFQTIKERAERKDPRIIRYHQQIEEEKNQKKLQKQRERQKHREEQAKIDEKNRLIKEEEDRLKREEVWTTKRKEQTALNTTNSQWDDVRFS